MLVEMLHMSAADTPVSVTPTADAGVYVMSGAVTLCLPDREIALEAGAFQLAPRGVAHSYRVGGEPAEVLCLSYPTGFERFAESVAAVSEVDPVTLLAA